MRRSRFPHLLLPAIAAVTVAACDPADPRTPVEGAEAIALASGPEVEAAGNASARELFAVCSTCHGPEGRGTQLAPPLTGPDWIHIQGEQEEIERIIREGVVAPRVYPIPMPPLGGGDFDADDVRSLASYVRSLGAG